MNNQQELIRITRITKKKALRLGETLRIEGRENSLSPEWTVIKCFAIPPTQHRTIHGCQLKTFIGNFPKQGVRAVLLSS